MDRPASGASATARTGARQRLSSTPASMALASATGMDATRRPSGRHNPHTTTSAEHATNAPTAPANPPSAIGVVASRAAPGVDHATLIGIRRHRLSAMPHSPKATDSAIRPEAACAGSAPMAVRPRRITAKELANPTKLASRPALSACGEKSRIMRRRAFRARIGWLRTSSPVPRR